MTLTRRGSAKQKHHARLQWLSHHQALIIGVPGIHDDVTDTNRAALDALHTQMRELGLFGASSLVNQREAVRRLVSELRGESVGVGW